MKRKTYFVLNDFIEKLDGEEKVGLYDSTGFAATMNVKDIPKKYLSCEVVKYKADNAMPNIHFKLAQAG